MIGSILKSIFVFYLLDLINNFCEFELNCYNRVLFQWRCFSQCFIRQLVFGLFDIRRLSSVTYKRMLGSVDATKRPLKIPAKFVPYMEKHRIYELFHELATGLIIQQPSDPILYLKQSLRLASKKRDLPRLILLGEPYSKILALASILQTKLGLKLITLSDVQKVTPAIEEENLSEEDIVRNLSVILKEFAIDFTGWILVGLPRTRREGRAIQRAGVIPTHVLEILTSPQKPCAKPESSGNESHFRGLRELYKNSLIKVETGDRDANALAEACATMAKKKKHCGAPCLFRVALIGPRGSGCRSVANYLSHRFKLVHVDFDRILEQTRLQENCFGRALREIEYRWGKRPKPDVRIRVVMKYLLGPECTKRGWVLTGYPTTVEDFKLLDASDTPPNRVIFVNLSKTTLRERIMSRSDEAATSNSEYSQEKELFITDDEGTVQSEIEEYAKNVTALKAYVGASGSEVDGDVGERNLGERVEACLMRPAPSAPPRVGKSRNKLEPIEFEPDDEPDHRALDRLRGTESILSFF
ncbi:adenylate kinase 8 [Venturia canescens]|uniref:adenylate kinase 8 n=1 Tax=Venturia canescens TaxID=32260 RepID=UPI001C9BFF39|nr:adenylate kinase 8-like [Venturia canescens]